jgi:hypothetical protein
MQYETEKQGHQEWLKRGQNLKVKKLKSHTLNNNMTACERADKK